MFLAPIEAVFCLGRLLPGCVYCCGEKKLMERCWRRSSEENLGVGRDGGASNYPAEPSRPSRFLIVWSVLNEKSGIAPAHVSGLALLVQADATILT